MRRALVVLVLATLGLPARAFVLEEDELEERSTELGVLVRSFSFVLTGEVLEPPFVPEDTNPTALGIFDLRLAASHRRSWLKVAVHNQLSGTVRSHSLGGPFALGRGVEPPRLLPLEWTLSDSDRFTVRDQIDWAYVTVLLGPVSVTVGRQPVTFGRGKLWQPIDLIATFALTEVDTEHKPGVDALRVDVGMAEKTVLTAVAAAGKEDDHPSLRASSFALRLSQGWSSGEAGLLLGLVRRDLVAGLDAVLDLGSFDLYSEVTLTVVTEKSLTPREPTTPPAVVRGLLGATLKLHSKVTLSPELSYSGFGAWNPADYLEVALSERLALGELYTLGRLYAGLVGQWEAHPLLNVTLASLVNARDPSALLNLGLRYNVAANVELVGGVYVPVGRRPNPDRLVPLLAVPEPRSEFGLYPLFVFIELKAAM